MKVAQQNIAVNAVAFKGQVLLILVPNAKTVIDGVLKLKAVFNVLIIAVFASQKL